MSDEPSAGRPLTRRAACLLPNALTLAAVVCGLTAIRLAAENRLGMAMAAIFVAAVLDTADGFAARRLSAVTAIGAELDTLADFVNFGVAPAMLLYESGLRQLGGAGWLAAAAYVLATGLRLARYNVEAKNAGGAGQRMPFRGLPSTGAAVAILIADAAAHAALQPRTAAIVLAAAAAGVSVLMLSTLSVPSLAHLFGRNGSGLKDG